MLKFKLGILLFIKSVTKLLQFCRKQNREVIVILAEHGSKPGHQQDPKYGKIFMVVCSCTVAYSLTDHHNIIDADVHTFIRSIDLHPGLFGLLSITIKISSFNELFHHHS